MALSRKSSCHSQSNYQNEVHGRKPRSPIDNQDALNSFMLIAGIMTQEELQLRAAKSKEEKSTRSPKPVPSPCKEAPVESIWKMQGASNNVRPVPGIPPHLWHLNQQKRQDASLPIKTSDPVPPKYLLGKTVGSGSAKRASPTKSTTNQLSRKRSDDDQWTVVPSKGTNVNKQWSRTWADQLHEKRSKKIPEVPSSPQNLFAESGRGAFSINLDGANERPPLFLPRTPKNGFANGSAAMGGSPNDTGSTKSAARGGFRIGPSGLDISADPFSRQAAPIKVTARHPHSSANWDKAAQSSALEASGISNHAVIAPQPVRSNATPLNSRQITQPPYNPRPSAAQSVSKATDKLPSSSGLLKSRHAAHGIPSHGTGRGEIARQPEPRASWLRHVPKPVESPTQSFTSTAHQSQRISEAPAWESAPESTKYGTKGSSAKGNFPWAPLTTPNPLSRHGVGFDPYSPGTESQEARTTSPPYHGHIRPLRQSFVPASDVVTPGCNAKVAESRRNSQLKGSPELAEVCGRVAHNLNDKRPFPSVCSIISSNISSGEDLQESTEGWESDEDDFGPNRSATHKMVCAWLHICKEAVRPIFLEQHVSEHWLCDVDTSTGILVAPIDVPGTMVDPADLTINTAEEMAADFRRRNYNASLVAAKVRGGLKQMMDGFLDKHLAHLITVTSPAEEKPQAHHVPMVITNREPPRRKPPKNPFVPGVFCYFRPATDDDMDGVCQIYNWEIRHGSQALDTQPLSNEDFRGILRNSQNNDMPFVVAVETLPNIDRMNQQPKQWDQPVHVPTEKILGFSYLGPWNLGIAGCLQGSTRFTGRLHVFVREGYRRNKIGCCLLDKILSVVSTGYQPKFKYHFVDPDKKPEYCRLTEGLRRQHPFYKLFVHYLLKRKGQDVDSEDPRHFDEAEGDEDLQWLQPLLENKFSFSLMPTRYSHVVRTVERPRRRPAWYDMVVFEHKCRDDPDPDSIFK